MVSSLISCIYLSCVILLMLTAAELCQREELCDTGICMREISCINGRCTDDGSCECQACYSGDGCDQYVNHHIPSFLDTDVKVRLTSNLDTSSPVYTAEAHDADCPDCLCGQMEYFLVSEDVPGSVVVSEKNGEIYLNNRNHASVSIEIGVKNQMDSRYTSMKLNILLDESVEVHKRAKRQNTQSIAPVTETDFTVYVTNNMSQVNVGDVENVDIIMTLPAGLTTDLVVEIFVPDDEQAVLALRSASIALTSSSSSCLTITSDLMASINDGAVKTKRSDDDIFHDSYLFTFDAFTADNTASCSGQTDGSVYSLTISYSYIVTNPMDAAFNNALFRMGCGIEYLTSTYLWVMATEHTLVLTDADISGEPYRELVFEVEGPDTLAIGHTDAFYINMYLPYSTIDVSVEVFADQDSSGSSYPVDTLSIYQARLFDLGTNYQYWPVENAVPLLTKSATSLSNYFASISMNSLINSGGNTASSGKDDNDLVAVQVILNVAENTSLIGEQLSFNVAVQIGSNLIWVAEIYLNVTDFPENEAVNNADLPTFSTAGAPSEISAGDVLTYTVTMTTKPLTTNYYTFEAISSFIQEEPLTMRICGAEGLVIGANLPYTQPRKSVELIGSEPEAYWHTKQVLGGLYNSDEFKTSTTTDDVSFEIYYTMVENDTTAADVGSTVSVTVGMSVGSNSVWVENHNMTVVEQSTYHASLEVGTLPKFAVTPESTDEMYPSKLVVIDLDVYYYPGSAVIRNQMIFGGTESNTFKVCQIEPRYVGKNMPCTTEKLIKAAINYTYETDMTSNITAIVDLVSVVNIGQPKDGVDFSTDPDNKISYRVFYKVMDDVSTDVATHPFFGLMDSDHFLWIGYHDVEMNASRTVPPKGTLEPYVYYTANINSVPGYQKTWTLIIKPPVRVLASYKIKLETKTRNVTITGIKLLRYGENYLCKDLVGETTLNDSRTVAEIQLNGVTNYVESGGSTPNTATFDEYSIELEATFHIRENADITYPVDVYIMYEDYVDTYPLSLQVETNPTADYTGMMGGVILEFNWVENEGTLSPSVIDSSSVSVHNGESSRFLIQLIFTADYTPRDLYVYLLIGNSTGDVLYLKPHVVAEQFACLPRGLYEEGYTDNSTVDTSTGEVVERSVRLGYLCEFPSGSSSAQIQMEGFVRLRYDNEQDSPYISAAIFAAEDEVITRIIQLTRSSDPLSTYNTQTVAAHGVTIEGPAVLPNFLVGQVEQYEFSISIEKFSSYYLKFLVNQTDKNFHFSKLVIKSAGLNVDGILNDNLTYAYTEVDYVTDYVMDSQTKSVVYDIGIITNTGVSSAVAEDDQITFALEVQPIEGVYLRTGLTGFEITANINDNADVTHNAQANVSRNYDAMADLNVITRMDCTELPVISPQSSANKNMTLSFNINHTTISTAYAHTLQIAVLLPPFLKYVADNNDGSFSVDSTTSTRIYITMTQLDLYKETALSLTLGVVPVTKKQIRIEHVNIPWILSYSTVEYNWSTRTFDVRDKTSTALATEQCSHIVEVPSKLECSELLELLSAGQITTAQVSGAPIVDYGTPLLHRFSFGVREPSNVYSKYQYVEVDLLTPFYIDYITIGPGVEQYLIEISLDGSAWIPTTKGPTSSSFLATSNVKINQLIYKIRINYLDTTTAIHSIKLYGCNYGSGIETAPVTMPTEYLIAPRQFLVSDTHLYVCDTQPKPSLPSSCNVMDIKTNGWFVMDKRLQNLIGLVTSNGMVFAITANGHYMVSKDGGRKWLNIHNDAFKMLQTDIDQSPVDIPWVTPLPSDALTSTYTQSTPSNSTIIFSGYDYGIARLEGPSSVSVVLDWFTTA